MNNKILAIMVEDLPWMYYGKYKHFLKYFNHPFKKKIDFIVDTKLNTSFNFIKQYNVVVFYHRDPLKHLYPEVYKYAKKIERLCLNNGIRFVNTPEALSRSIKSEQLKTLLGAGFLVAKNFKFRNISELSHIKAEIFPIFVRNNIGHDSDNLTVQGPFNNYNDMLKKYKYKSLGDKKHLDGKVAIQWIDTRSPKDGLYRRYRVFATSIDAIPGNVYASNDWYTHGMNSIVNSSTQYENNNFKNKKFSKKQKNFFIKINITLGLEFSAIDYSYTSNGKIIIWEVNPHPALSSWVDQGKLSKLKIVKLLSNFYKMVLKKN